MKTQKEIEQQIVALKEIRPKVCPFSIFGNDNLAQLDAQVDVLENCLDNDDIYEKYDHSSTDEEILGAALYANEWIDGNYGVDNLAEDYPLKE